jgi:hypothetical protein
MRGEQFSNPLFLRKCSHLSLDDGVDHADGCAHRIDVNERALTFCSPWSFALGTRLEVALCDSSRGGPEKIQLRGAVIACARIDERCRRVTLLFEEVPPRVCRQLARMAQELEAEESAER